MVRKLFKRWRSRLPASASTVEAGIDVIQADDDVSAFLNPEVDEARQREVLRALFRQPKFNQCDGLDDYDEDYRLAHTGSRIGPHRQA